jgi:ligand-binding sensor domain-containing protein
MRLGVHFIQGATAQPVSWRRWLAVFVLTSLPCGLAVGQYRFDYWTTDNGLPQNSVYAITQTREGYLWLATVDGLVRFDGVRFTIFDQSNSKGLTSNRFTCLYEDAEGTLWAGTEDGGIVRYRDGTFSALTTANGLADNHVRLIQADPEGGLSLATAKGWGQYHNGRFSLYPGSASWLDQKVYWGASGTRWVWDKTGLHQSKNKSQTDYQVSGKPSYLFESRDGTLWAGQLPNTVLRVKDGTVTRYTTKDGLPILPADSEIGPFIEDRQGNLWIATGAGLVRFRSGRFTTYTTADGLSSNGILSVFEDREGTIWVGTTAGGLNRLTRQFITAYSTKDGLAGNNVYPIYEDAAGNIWIGTTGLSRFTNGVFTNYAAAKGGGPRLPTDVQAICEDRAGRLWVSGYSWTVYLKGGKLTEPLELAGRITGAQAIYEDRQGTLWFGTFYGAHKLRDGILTSYTIKDGLPGDDVKVIHEDRQGNLWFGTYGGLARLKDGRFTGFTTEDGLGSNRVRSLYEDAEGTLWVGTYDGGLSRLKDGRITTYKVTQGLFNSGVFQILEDGRGNFWLSCNRGIYRVSRQQLNDFADGRSASVTCIAYGKLDGMLSTECNGGRQPAGLRARDGKLWFPTQGGVVVIDPEAVPFNAQPPPVLIEAVSLDGAALDLHAGVRVEPGQASLLINYTGLSYVKPEQVRFKYRLLGQDETWVDAGTRRVVNYSYLSPGQYTFQVSAANSDGVWNNEGASLRIMGFIRTFDESVN